jgi:heat shock protein 1/8
MAEEDVKRGEELVEKHLKWLEEHEDAELEAYKGAKKDAEEDIRPILMKMYAAKGADVKDYSGAAADAAEPAPGPKVEEVD